MRHVQLPLAAALLAAAPLAAQQQQPQSTGEPWRLVQPPQSSLVYARDGSLIGEIGREWRTSVAIKTLPKYVGQAFVAVEDKRFYQHNGVDVVGVAAALKDAVLGDARGASTITQQLVGNMHPDVVDRRDRSVGRKLREQEAAREMERHYSKEQILEAYLNQINFGHGWYGVEAAARHYFGRPASKLTLAEAASLAAMPASPVGFDPARYPEKNRDRRNTVLALMAQQGYITADQARAARDERVVTVPNGGMSATAPYFVDVVRAQAERGGVPVMNGGYRIYTTLDPSLQRAATIALVEGTAAVEMRPGYKHNTYLKRPKGSADYLQGAVVALDPVTGEVRALVGGRNYQESPFNRAVSGVRQPGSAFKPVVYALAVTDSITPTTIVHDTALSIPLPTGETYQPGNSDGKFLGALTLREALTLSRNPVAVELGQQLGIDSVAALGHALGIKSDIAPVPSSAIGASVLRPLELVAAYAAFANLGSAVEPSFVVRVEDRNGRTVWAPEPAAPALALDPRVAFIVRDMMRDVVERGTATSIRRVLPPTIPVAGKTGTTNDNADVWFVGMTPEIVAGVWLGFDRPKTITPGAAGGSLAAPIFGSMMQRWYAGRTAGTWEPPAGLVSGEMDRLTGMVADASTPPERRYVEYFLEGTEPEGLRFDPWRIFSSGAVITVF
ncbi:MAG TPA: PBP1A family penicillin-binding protein [Gemmatimonadaceae bacterium]|nr:PBP1A family penicillin-binding protein [Gemmatimonadaceae bacterium]